MRKEIARITSTMLGLEDHGILTFFLHVDYGGKCQGIGGRLLSTGVPPRASSCVGDLVLGILRACGVRRWEDLPGRTIYALFEDGAGWSDQPIGIENLPTEAGGQFLFADALK